MTGFDKTRLQRTELRTEHTFKDMVILSNDSIVTSWYSMLKDWNLQQELIYLLATIVWVHNFQMP